jgi:hypothetical protein
VSEPHNIFKSTRRQFAKALAAIAAAPLLPRATASSEPLVRDVSTAAIGKSTASSFQTPADQKPSPDAEALAQLVRLRYGKELSDDQMNEVKRSIDNRLRNADRMKQFKLANGDEPVFIFSA